MQTENSDDVKYLLAYFKSSFESSGYKVKKTRYDRHTINNFLGSFKSEVVMDYIDWGLSDMPPTGQIGAVSILYSLWSEFCKRYSV